MGHLHVHGEGFTDHDRHDEDDEHDGHERHLPTVTTDIKMASTSEERRVPQQDSATEAYLAELRDVPVERERECDEQRGRHDHELAPSNDRLA